MEDKQYIEQLKDIRNLMDRSSRFVSLSGLSGVMAGIYAILGALTVKYIIHSFYTADWVRKTYEVSGTHFKRYIILESTEFLQIVIVACTVVVLSVATAIILSWRKARKRNEKAWNATSKRMLINFSIPLITGGIFGIMLLKQGHYGLISPVTLIFYGLSLLNGSKYTLETLRSLGISFIVLGLINTMLPGYGLQFWTIGFGFFHIIYGTYMYIKFDRKQTA